MMTAATFGPAARAAIDAAERSGVLPTDRAEWLSAAAQDLADGRLGPAPSVTAARTLIIERANELICVGPDLKDAELPRFG